MLWILVPVQFQISFILIAKDFLRKCHAVKLRRCCSPFQQNCQFRNNSSLNNVKIALYAIAVPVRNVNKSGARTLLATGGHVTFLPYRPVTTSSDRHQKRTTKTGSLEPDRLDWAAKRAHWNMLVETCSLKRGLKRWDRTSGQSFLRWTVTRRSLPPSSRTVSNGKRLPSKISWSSSVWARKLSDVLSMRLPQDPPLYWRYAACCVLSLWSPRGPTNYTDRSAP